MSDSSSLVKNDTRSLRVIIVGGGIGGLSAAIALRRRGHEPLVLERAPKLDPVGAGITLFANAMNALDRLGVAQAVAAAGAIVRHSAIRTSDGRQLTTLPADLLEGAVAVHRGDLQTVLLEAAGEVRLGVEIEAVDQIDDEVVARSADGFEERAQLLAEADGLRSFVRGSVAPSAPRYGSYTAWRGVSPVRVEPSHLTESWGVGERFGLVDIGSRTYWFATGNVPEGETDEPTARKAELLRRISDWHAPIASVLGATPKNAILRNDVYFLKPLPRWSEGRIVLLGAAAHATTPGIGQGAAQASRTPPYSRTSSPNRTSSGTLSPGTRRFAAHAPNPRSSSHAKPTEPPSSQTQSPADCATSSSGAPRTASSAGN